MITFSFIGENAACEDGGLSPRVRPVALRHTVLEIVGKRIEAGRLDVGMCSARYQPVCRNNVRPGLVLYLPGSKASSNHEVRFSNRPFGVKHLF
jgi:hypothetical protein